MPETEGLPLSFPSNGNQTPIKNGNNPYDEANEV